VIIYVTCEKKIPFEDHLCSLDLFTVRSKILGLRSGRLLIVSVHIDKVESSRVQFIRFRTTKTLQEQTHFCIRFLFISVTLLHSSLLNLKVCVCSILMRHSIGPEWSQLG